MATYELYCCKKETHEGPCEDPLSECTYYKNHMRHATSDKNDNDYELNDYYMLSVDRIKAIGVFADKRKNTGFATTMAQLLIEPILNYDSCEDDKNDFETVARSVQHRGMLLCCASIEMRNNFDIVKYAVMQDEMAFYYCEEKMSDNIELAKLALARNNPLILQQIRHMSCFDDIELNKYIFDHSGIYEVSTQMLNNIEFIKYAVEQDGTVLKEILLSMKCLRDDLIRHNGTLRFSPIFIFMEYRNIVEHAVKHRGSNLQYASDKLRADFYIVSEAVSQDGTALQYASDELRANVLIVNEAVSQDGTALQYASDELRADFFIVIFAITQNRDSFKFASNDLQNDIKLAKYVKKTHNLNYDSRDEYSVYIFGILQKFSKYLKN